MAAFAPTSAEPAAEAERADAAAPSAPEPEAVPELDEAHATPPPSAVAFDLPDPLVQELVRILAPMLGLDAARVEIGRGPAAAEPGRVTVPRPERPVVAHELAHVAQHANRARPGAVADTTGAEAEAAGLEAAARAGTPLWAPRGVLPEGRVARLQDSSGVAPATDAAILAADLDILVKTTRAAELQRIKDAGSGVFATAAEATEGLLQVLQTLDFVTARAVVHALEQKDRIALAHLFDSLHKRYPGAAAAVLAGLQPDDVQKFAEAEPMSLRDALHGLDASQLDANALRAVLDTLRNVPQSVLIELERGDRRDAFRSLLGAPAPPGTELEALQIAQARELAAFKAAADDLAKATMEKLRPAISASDKESAHRGLELLAPLAGATVKPPPKQDDPIIPGVPDTPAPAPAATEVPAKAKGSNAPPTPDERLRAIVTAMDAEGLVDRILDGLPEEERYEGDYTQTLKLVLGARAPALTLPRIESLLSYGIFDWAIRDYEARWAYLLVRTLPLPIQDGWRLLDAGKWFQRLGDNIPEELIRSGEYTGVGSEYVIAAGELTDDEKKAAQERFNSMRMLWKEHSDAATAKWIARLLLGIDPETAQPMTGADKDLKVRIGAVRRLDTVGMLEEVYREFPEDYLLGETGRHEVTELTLMRDPVQIEQNAAKLLATGFTDWQISSREAWIAYQLLRQLPAATQQRFQAADPARWSNMMSAMTAEMRQSLATGAATGRGPFPGRDQLRERLKDPKLWNAAHAPELRALMDLARATDDAEWVFEQSRVHNAYSIPGLEELVEGLQLYDPRPAVNRTSFTGENLELRPGFFEFLRWVDELAGIKWILMGLGAWLIMDWIQIGQTSIHVKDFDLSWAEWAAGGDLGGAKLADRPMDSVSVGAAKKKAGGETAPPVKANTLNMTADLGTGAVRLRLPELAVKSLNIVRAGSSYRTGPLTLRNLRVQGDFSDRHYREPVGVELDADRVDVDDFVLANPSLPGGAWALAQLMLQPIHLKAGATGDEDLSAHPPREGSIPIPIFGPLLEALSNIVALKGAIPFDYTLVDFALIAPTSGMSLFASTPIGLAANAAVPTPAPIDYLWGLATDGTLRPPRSVADRAKDAIAMLKSFEIAFDELTISGLSIGSGQQISTLTLKDVNIGVGQSRPAYLRILIKSLTRLRDGMVDGPDRVAIQKRITDAQAELDGTKDKPGLTAAEAELEKLERKDRWIAGSLSDEERKRLVELSDLVRRDTGIVADIGGIQLGALSGKIEAGGASIGAIHLEGRLPLNTAGYLTDEDLAERFAAGGAKAPTVAELVKGGDVRLTIASASIVPGKDGEPALRILADRVPTEAELNDRLAKMPTGVDQALRGRIEEARDVAHDLEILQAKSPKSSSDQDFITAKTNRLRQLLGVEIGSLTLGPIDGGLDPKTGSLKATVHNVDAQDIAGDGFAVKRVSGDLSLGVKGLGGMGMDYREVTGDAAKKALTAQFGLDVKVEGIKTESGTIGEVSISGLHADVNLLDDGYKVSNLWATRIGIKDVNFGDGGASVTAVGVTLEGVGLDAEVHMRQVGDKSELASAVVSRLDINKLTADTIKYRAARTSEGDTLDVEIKSGSLGGIRARDLSVAQDADGARELSGSVSVAGVEKLQYGVVMGALNSKTKALEKTTIEGTVQGGTMVADPLEPTTAEAAAKGPKPVIDAQFATGKDGKSYSLGLRDLALLGTHITTPDGSVVIKRIGLSGTVTGTDGGLKASLDLDKIDISHVDWRAGTATIKSDGAITLDHVHVEAKLMEPDPTSADPQKRAGGLWIDDFDITDLDADQLTYKDPPIDVHLSRFKDPHPGALHAKRIRLQKFFRPYTVDGKSQKRVLGKPTGGSLAATDVHADFGGAVAAGMNVTGGVDAKLITVDIFEQDTLVVRAQGVSGDFDVDMDGNTAHAAISGFDTGVLTITPEAIYIGGDGKPGLHLDLLHVDDLTVVNAKPPHPFSLFLQDTGAIDIINVDLTAKIERWKPGEKHDADQPFKKAVITQLEIAAIEAEGLWLKLPDDGVIVRIPTVDEYKGTGPLPKRATLKNIYLTGEEGFGAFEWVPGKAGYKKGKLGLDEISIPKLTADVSGKFHGSLDLHTDAASIGFAQSGDTVIDLANPRAKLLDEAWLDNPDRKLMIEEIGAKGVHVDLPTLGATKVKVTDAYANRLRFSQPGILIETRKATLPGETNVQATEGKIPTLQIDDAHIHIDFTKLPGSSGGGSAFPIERDSITKLIDSLQGDLSLKVYLSVKLPALDPRDLEIPVALHFTNGKLDFQKLQDSLQGKIGAKVATSTDSESYLLEALASRPEFWFEKEDTNLVFGLHITDVVDSDPNGMSSETTPVVYEIVRWNLASDELWSAKNANKIRLARLINPIEDAPDPDESPKDKLKKEQTTDALLRSIELRDINADLSIQSDAPIRLDVRSPTLFGSVVLSKNALMHLKAGGGIPASKRPPSRTLPGQGGLKAISMDALNFDSVGIFFGSEGLIKTAGIEITKVHDGTFEMDALYPPHPQTFDATITSATAHDIEWDLLARRK